jgi:hypothetical protein
VNEAPDADATPSFETSTSEGATADSESPDAACGPGPWVTLGLEVDRFDLSTDGGSPLPGAVFAASICPGLAVTSDDAGHIVGRISKGVPFTAALTASGYISELTPEQAFDADSTGNRIEMLPSLFQALLPGFTSQSTAILLQLDPPLADAGPCSTVDGVSFSVPGHAEATVTYFSAGALPAPVAGATATTASGLAAITGLASGLTVSPLGAKAGCTIQLQHDSLTGRVALKNGFASLVSAVISP